MANRQITAIEPSQPATDGDGVAIRRIFLAGRAQVDPVLMIDELRSPFRRDFEGGFPAHPHRGMQTLTYMKEGGIIHEDSLGNRGEIRGGGAQWLSAGSGVIHSEMPTLDTQGLHGFQLWFNLPAADKMQPPRYRDIPAGELAVLDAEGFSAVAIAGEWSLGSDAHTVVGPLAELVPQGSLLDLTLGSNVDVDIALDPADTAMAYVYDGAISRQSGSVAAGHLVVAEGGDRWVLTAGAGGARMLVITGRPIGEPVAHYGPFVMNTAEEIRQAVLDYQSGNLLRH